MKNSFTFRNNFLQNIIDLINFEALYSQFIGASTRERHRHLREQTFHVWFLRRIQWEGGIDQILNFFFSPFRSILSRRDTIRHDRIPRSATRSNYEIIEQRGTLCCRVWLVSFYWRLLVSPWTAILRIRDHVVVHHGCASWWTVDAFVSQNHRGSIETGFDRYEPRFHGIMSIDPRDRDFICFQDLFRKSRFG